MNLSLPMSILVCGKPRSGKSHTIKFILYQFTAKKDLYKRFSYGIIFSKTAFNRAYDYVPNQWVYSQYKPEVLEKLMNLQKGIRANGYVPPHVFVVFDDCLGAAQFKSDLFKDLIQNYRHYNISPIISTQYINRIETVNRECVSHAIIFRPFTKNSITSLYESFGQLFDSEKEFKLYLLKNTGNYSFVLVDNESLEDKLSNAYKIFRCPPKIPNPNIPYLSNIDITKLTKE